MSRDKTIVPTGIFDWPRFKTLDTVQRLVYMQLWASRDIMSIGVGLVSHAKLADGSSQAISAIPGILDFISQKGLIDYDSITGEVFIVDWFRFHVFRGVGVKIVEKELQKIESKAIRRGVIKAVKANKNCGINLEKNDLNKSEIDEKDDFPEKSSTCSANTNINNNINNTHPAPEGAGGAPPEGGGECVKQENDGKTPFPSGLYNAIMLKVPKSRRPTFKNLVESARLSNGQPLLPMHMEAMFEKLTIANDPVAFIKGVQKKGGWDPRTLADMARPGETFHQVRRRILSKEGQTPPAAQTTSPPLGVPGDHDQNLVEWVKPRNQDFKNWLNKQRDIVSIHLLETSNIENPGLKNPIKKFFAFSQESTTTP